MWKKLRIAFLLLVLFLIGSDAFLTHYRTTSWDKTLWVAVYPINPDNDPVVTRYIQHLSSDTFKPIETFFTEEAEHAHLPLTQPFKMVLAHTVDEIPPAPPQDKNTLKIMWWSLKLRWWVYRHDHTRFSPHIRVFVIYHNYDKERQLAHSLGLEKGMIGVVHAYAHREMQGENNMVIAHEMLHTVGATDKYDLQTHQPLYPQGYANPEKKPLYPQEYAALMAGRIPLSRDESVMPRGLFDVIIGEPTLVEIKWIKPK